mgnify:CR=1 FL=1
MQAYRFRQYAAGRLLWLAVAALLMWSLGVVGAAEQTFGVLQIGTRTYTNVTVTTKAKNYVFIVHAGGMVNLKVADLPPDVQQQLGYAAPPSPVSKLATNAAALWVKKEIAKVAKPGFFQRADAGAGRSSHLDRARASCRRWPERRGAPAPEGGRMSRPRNIKTEAVKRHVARI